MIPGYADMHASQDITVGSPIATFDIHATSTDAAG